MSRLVVLGAGPAGLGAAYRAARAGVDVVVVERAERVGGAAGSFDLAGVRVDYGSHRLHPATDPAIAAELQRLLGGDLQRRRRNGRIRLGGRWLAFPLRPGDAARNLGASFLARAAVDAATSWARRPRDDTFAEHLRAGLGPTMCERFYFPYARKLWGLEPEELSAEQARRRVSANRPGKLAGRLLRRGSDAGVFSYPRRGYGQLSERLAEAAVEAGAQLRLSTPAEAVAVSGSDGDGRPDRGGVTVSAGGGRLHADFMFSTIPVTVLAGLVRPAAPDPVLDAAGRLEHRGMLLAYLVVAGERYSPFDAHYFPEGGVAVSRLSEPKNYRDGAGADPDDVTVLCAELPCQPGDATWTLDEAGATELVVDALRRCGLPAPRVLETHLRRLPRAYPVYRRGFEAHFDVVDRWVSGLPGLLTFGRQGLFVHDNTHHALAMAWAAVDAITDRGVDRQAWARARERFAAHVVED